MCAGNKREGDDSPNLSGSCTKIINPCLEIASGLESLKNPRGGVFIC
jgi:hypothetical protein